MCPNGYRSSPKHAFAHKLHAVTKCGLAKWPSMHKDSYTTMPMILLCSNCTMYSYQFPRVVGSIGTRRCYVNNVCLRANTILGTHKYCGHPHIGVMCNRPTRALMSVNHYKLILRSTVYWHRHDKAIAAGCFFFSIFWTVTTATACNSSGLGSRSRRRGLKKRRMPG